MKTVLKIIGIALLAIIIVILLMLKILGSRPAAPVRYQQSVQTGGEIEKKYMANGPWDVSTREEGALQSFGKYTVYYPSALETGGEKYPVIVLCNGSGTPLSKYPAVAQHFASWGFIVIGTEETYAWNAFGAEMCLRYLERWNEQDKIGDTVSPFYQKVDLDNVGIVGHSQGGVGVINAVTNTRHKHVYKAAVALSPTNKELAHQILWDYDATSVDIPMMLIAGAGGGDDWVVTGEQLRAIYDDITADKLMVRRRDTAHNQVLYSANGYVMAWFMWHLRGDEEAARAFTGGAPEIMSNPMYQDQQMDLGSLDGV